MNEVAATLGAGGHSGQPVSGGVCVVCSAAGVVLTSRWFLGNPRQLPSFSGEARVRDQNRPLLMISPAKPRHDGER